MKNSWRQLRKLVVNFKVILQLNSSRCRLNFQQSHWTMSSDSEQTIWLVLVIIGSHTKLTQQESSKNMGAIGKKTLKKSFKISWDIYIIRPFIEGVLCDRSLIIRAPDFFHFELLNKSENYVDTIRKFYFQTGWFRSQSASWNHRYKPEFTEMLTKFGFGFSFNMMPKVELFTEK